MFDVIGIGALNVDLIYQVDDVQEIDPEIRPGQETFIPRQRFLELLERAKERGNFRGKSGGGQAANTVVALAKMGFKAGYVGAVGVDGEGDFLLQNLEDVDVSSIRRTDESGLCLCLVSGDGERTNLLLPNSNDSLSYDQIDAEYIDETRILYLSSFAGSKPFSAQKELVNNLGPDTLVALDPGELYSKKGLEELRPMLARTDFLFLTEREMEEMTKATQVGGLTLLEAGAKVVVVKQGAAGASVIASQREFSVPAEPTKVLDTTGAGDVFAAGFLAGILLNRPLDECAKIASKATALGISGYGREKYPTHHDLRDFLER